MDDERRNKLIDMYFDAMDDETFTEFEQAFTVDIEYRYPDEPDMHGIDAVQAFFEERREHSNSSHNITRRIADETMTVCEGTVTAEKFDGSTLEADFADVFEFDDESGGINRVRVYTRT